MKTSKYPRLVLTCIGLVLIVVVLPSCSTTTVSSKYSTEQAKFGQTNDVSVAFRVVPARNGKVTVPVAVEVEPTTSPATKVPVRVDVENQSTKTVTVPVNVTVENPKTMATTKVPLDINVVSHAPDQVSLPLGVSITATNTTPQVNVPLAVQVTADNQQTITVPMNIRTETAPNAPINVPVTFSFPTGSIPQLVIPVTLAPDQSGRGVGGWDDLWRLFIIIGVIAGAGLTGGRIRSIEDKKIYLLERSRKELDLATAKEKLQSLLRTKDISETNCARELDAIERWFDDWCKSARQSYETQKASNGLWGILAASLVPAMLTVVGSPILDKLLNNAGYVAVLWGFCLAAATIGAAFFYRALSALGQTLVSKNDRENQ